MRAFPLVVALGAAWLGLAACGAEETPRPTEPPPAPPALPGSAPAEWRRARLPGVPSASGVAVVGGHLLVSTSEASELHAGRRSDLADGATLSTSVVTLGADGDRDTLLKDGESAREVRQFPLKQLWAGPQRISGVAVAPGEKPVLYVASEAYRLVWFGPLLLDAEGRPARALFQRASEVPGANRTRRAESDWQDYGDPQAANGLAGLCVDGEDVLVVERGRGAREPGAWRLDRVSGTTIERIGMRLAAPPEEGEVRWWSDVQPVRGGFLASLVRSEQASSSGRILMLPVARKTRNTERVAARPWLAFADSLPGDTVEGFAVGDGQVFAVRSDAEGGSVLLWRPAP